MSLEINFVLPHTGVSGGVRVVYELANKLEQKGHDITVLFPIVPSSPNQDPANPKKLAKQLVNSVRRWRTSSKIEWFDLTATLMTLPALGLPSSLLNRFIPDADMTIATSWETAYPLSGWRHQRENFSISSNTTKSGRSGIPTSTGITFWMNVTTQD